MSDFTKKMNINISDDDLFKITEPILAVCKKLKKEYVELHQFMYLRDFIASYYQWETWNNLNKSITADLELLEKTILDIRRITNDN